MPLSQAAIDELRAIHEKETVTNGLGYSLTPEDIREFQGILREETGIELPSGEAWNRAIELVSLVRMLVSPFPEDREK